MAELKDPHLVLSQIGLEFAGHTGKLYIYPGRIKFRDWYNHKTGRNVCIRTIDNYIARLVEKGHWRRTARTLDMGIKGKQFTSSMTEFLGPGLKALQRFGIEAFAIINKIKAVVHPRKKRSPSTDVKGDRSGSTARIGTVIKGIMKLPVSS